MLMRFADKDKKPISINPRIMEKVVLDISDGKYNRYKIYTKNDIIKGICTTEDAVSFEMWDYSVDYYGNCERKKNDK